LLERQDDDGTPFRLQILTDLPASRLAPSGLRPNALPLHNVRDRGPQGNGLRTDILTAGHSAFVTLSACALNETDKSHRMRIGKLQSARHFVKTLRPGLWWSQTGSNRRPHACKARALPTELWPRFKTRRRPKAVVGLGGLEPPTSRLSSARSNQLSYKPGRRRSPNALMPLKQTETSGFHILRLERETKAARSRKRGLTKAA
jgi:hypothetical protein